MNKQQLASLIWDYCNGLRGSISTVEYKDFILGLIFYKFLSEKEKNFLFQQGWTEEILSDELNEKDTDTVKQCQDNLGYFIGYDNLFSTWKKIGDKFNVANVSDGLNSFSRNIDSKHIKIYSNIFKSLSDKITKLGTVTEQTKHLKKIIKIVDRIPMDKNQGYDVLGFIYEYLLANFASNAGKKDGEFYTPHEISILMSDIVANHLKNREAINIYDPTSGSGSLLINIGQSIQKYLNNTDNIVYYAQEKIDDTFNLTRMNLIMRGINPSNIFVRCGDTLATDWPYIDDQQIYKYVPVDCVVSNPPYSQKWDADANLNDKRYKKYGIAPSSKADYAFLLHDLYHLKDDGIMCIVLPHGVLFRGGDEKEIRKNLIDNNNIESIIGLPPNIFYGTGISTIIMVLKKNRKTSDVLFIDASKEFVKIGNKNKLTGANIKKITDTVLSRKSFNNFSRLVKKDEISKNDFNLNIAKYVSSNIPEILSDINSTIFGNVPNSEIEIYKDYWDVFATLKKELFDSINNHTSKVISSDILETINSNKNVIEFKDKFLEAFKNFDLFLSNLLIDINFSSTLNIEKIKSKITNKIFEICGALPIIDKYVVYNAFEKLWQEISIDIELIKQNGKKIIKEVEDVEEYDKKLEETVIVGQEGKIIPFRLIQQILYSDDFKKMQRLEHEHQSLLDLYEIRWNELDDELKAEISKADDPTKIDNKLLKEKYLDAVKPLSNTEIKNLEKYLSINKTLEKIEFQNTHNEIHWPSDTFKTKKGIFKKSSIDQLIFQIKNNIEIDESEADYKYRDLFILHQNASIIKKQINLIKKTLDEVAKDKLIKLNDQEIKCLLKEKWITPILNEIKLIPENLINNFATNVKNIINKYLNPIKELSVTIDNTEKKLSEMLKDLVGDKYDVEAINEFSKILSSKLGDENE